MEMPHATEIAPHNWYSHTTGMVLLDLNGVVEKVKPQIIDGIELVPKEEYHTTLVSVRREISNPKQEAHFIRNLSEFLIQNPVELSVIGLERYLCRKGDEATVIAPVHLFGEHALKSFVKQYIPGYDPFYHVTLLKSEHTEHGIRVSSPIDLQERCRKL